ncbi:MAG TPA: ParA family partition ATPase [Gemmatimonadales bacterium]|nr:ParA family partition ATPase [Gemmatimonadales bacterium]
MTHHPITIALAGQKGGAGKTTTALALACEWHARGHAVLLVDADPQGTARTWAAVAAEAGTPAPTVIAMGEGMHRPGQLDTVSVPYDLVVIDCPGRHDTAQRSALLAADMAILPCGPSAADVWSLDASAALVGAARAARAGRALDAAVLITRRVRGTLIGAGARAACESVGLPVLDSELGFRVAYQEAPAAGLGVAAYDVGGEAAREVRRLCDELDRRLGIMTREVRRAG